MTLEEINLIKKEIFSEADNMYVRVGDCNENQEKVNNRFANDDKRIEIMKHDFAIIKKLIWVVATASIGSLVTAVLEFILK